MSDYLSNQNDIQGNLLQQGEQNKFALSPTLVRHGIIDYSTPYGVKIYHSAIAPIFRNPLFDCEPTRLRTFLNAVRTRSKTMGWNNILLVPEQTITMEEQEEGQEEVLVNISSKHGERSMEQIRSHVETYITKENRVAQDSAQLYMCLISSLSPEGLSKIMVWESEFTIHDITSGPLLLKVIIRESDIDMNASIRNVRNKLSNLDKYLPSIEGNITKFNLYVKNLLAELNSHGEGTQDLLVNLFKGYSSATDKTFLTYIQHKEDEYDEGGKITADNLMQLVSNKYKVLVDKGAWNTPSSDEQKIISLQAQIKTLTYNKSNSNAKNKRKNNPSKTSKESKKKKNKKGWKKQPPKDGECTPSRMKVKTTIGALSMKC